MGTLSIAHVTVAASKGHGGGAVCSSLAAQDQDASAAHREQWQALGLPAGLSVRQIDSARSESFYRLRCALMGSDFGASVVSCEKHMSISVLLCFVACVIVYTRPNEKTTCPVGESSIAFIRIPQWIQVGALGDPRLHV